MSELIDARTYKQDLEKILEQHEEQSQKELENYKRQVADLKSEVATHREKLDAKSDALDSLISELSQGNWHNVELSTSSNQRPENDKNMATDNNNLAAKIIRSTDDGIARMLISRFDDRELRFPLFKDRLTIGRTRDNDIQLKAQFISRRHAVICSGGGEPTRIVDWDSKNGVFVNSKRITEHFLADGDIVTIGDSEFRYEERAKSRN